MDETGTASGVVPSPPTQVCGLLTDIDRLPEWNVIMTRLVDSPDVHEPGAEWVVEFKALGNAWRSRSRVEEYDVDRHVFAYRSWTDDANPSYARGRWTVEPAGGARSAVT